MRIRFIFIGDPQESRFGENKVAGNISTLTKYVNPDNANYSAIDNRIAPIDQENEFYKQAVRYAYPDLKQEDFTPGYEKSAVVGEASNKTLGSFPVFSAAVVAPADIWSKRRKAITDFMLDQEKLKNQGAKQLEYPKYELGSGSPNVEGAINGATLNQLQGNYQQGESQGIPMNMSTVDPRHPFYWKTQSILNKNRQLLDLSKDLDANAKEVRKLDLSSGNMFSRATSDALDSWDKFSSMPMEQQLEFFKKDNGEPGGMSHAMQNWNKSLVSVPNLENVTNNYVKGIKEKAQSSVQSGESGGVQDFIINQLKSQYPLDALEKDKSGKIIYNEANQDKFLTSVATNIAKNKPELFNDFQKDDNGKPLHPDGSFSMADLKDYIKDQLGYEYTTSIHTATTPGAAANATVSAVPTDIMADVSSKLSKGTPVDIGKGQQIIPGKNAMTYVDEHGNLQVIPKSNVPENINKTVEFGVKEPTKFGGIDESSAKTNILNRQDVYKHFNEKMGDGRPVESTSKDFAEKFNNDLYEIGGKNPVPLAGAGIGITGVKNVSGSKNDDDFFFSYKDKAGANTGVIVPSDIMQSTVKEKGWLSFLGPWFDNDKKVLSVSGNGVNTTLSGTYYHKEEPDRNGVVNYTVYNTATKTPYLIKSKDGSKVPIVVPQYQVQQITGKPAELIQQANQNYKQEEDRIYPHGVNVQTTANPATIKAKGQSVGATETGVNTTSTDKFGGFTDDQVRAAHYLVSKTPGLNIDAALQSVKNGESGTDVSKKAKLANIYQHMQGTSVDSIKSLYK